MGEGNGHQSPQDYVYTISACSCVKGKDCSQVDTAAIPIRCLDLVDCFAAMTFDFESSKTRMMADDKLKSTTVRFTDSDLVVLNHLREKLGLGMIQVIRLAIRRLAEIENVLPLSPARKKD
jgi:hypothetical protein